MRRGRTIRSAAVFGAGLLAATTLSACSNTGNPAARAPLTGSSTASMVNGVQQVTIVVDSGYRFHPSTITVHPGKVRIVLRHTGTGAPHNWSLDGFKNDYVPLTQAGQTKTTEFVAPRPGKYRFECTLHVQLGQVGTLIVLPH